MKTPMPTVAPTSDQMTSDLTSRPTTPPVGRVIAGCLALGGFATALIAGLAADNATEVVLGRAIACLFGSYALGLLVGYLCEFAVSQHLERYRSEYPAPDSDVTVDELVEEMQREGESAPDSPVRQAERKDDAKVGLAARPE